MNVEVFCFDAVAPVRERGLKLIILLMACCVWRRSREGAWIEIVAVDKSKVGFCVAPVRERGLKSDYMGIACASGTLSLP